LKKLNSQERLCEIIQHLSKNHLKGLKNKEFAVLLNTSASNISRDLATLEEYDLVMWGSKTWRLSPQFGKIGKSIYDQFEEAKKRMKEER